MAEKALYWRYRNEIGVIQTTNNATDGNGQETAPKTRLRVPGNEVKKEPFAIVGAGFPSDVASRPT